MAQNDALINLVCVQEDLLFFGGEPIDVLYTAHIVNDVTDGVFVVDALGLHGFVEYGWDATQLANDRSHDINHARIMRPGLTDTAHQQRGGLGGSIGNTVGVAHAITFTPLGLTEFFG